MKSSRDAAREKAGKGKRPTGIGSFLPDAFPPAFFCGAPVFSRAERDHLKLSDMAGGPLLRWGPGGEKENRRFMKETSRKRNALRNSIVGILAKSIAILGGYLTRILLVREVSPELVGLNGLFFTILGGLMLNNMGLDTAMAYSLFRPVAQGDLVRQRALLKFYRRVYLCFSGGILLIGLCVYAFLPAIVREDLDGRTVSLVYFLFLLNTILSYQWASRRTLIFALQKDYVSDLFASGFWILQYAAQCLILILTGSFPLFLLAEAVCTGLKNLSVTAYACRRHPFPREPSAPDISKEEKKALAGISGPYCCTSPDR
jgi:hypothetical protein